MLKFKQWGEYFCSPAYYTVIWNIMQIELTKQEEKIIWAYRTHLWKFKNGGTFREILNRIITECGEELKMVQRELLIERKTHITRR